MPFSRLIIPFLAGIIIAFQIPDLSLFWLILPLLLLIVCILFERVSIVKLFKWRHLHAFTISCVILISVVFLHQSYIIHNKPYHFSKHINSDSYLLARLSEVPEEGEKNLKCVLDIKGVINGDSLIKYKGKLLAYFQTGDKANQLFYNDLIIIKAKISDIPPRLNPAQFDYQKFLSYKRIYHQVFLKDTNWIKSEHQAKFAPLTGIMKLRMSIISELKKSIKNKDDMAIAAALLVGYKTELSDEVRLSFVSTGAMHVLAVSGLHVGIIFMVFSLLTKFLKRLKYGKLIFVLINLFLLWTYAILTGFSPSVLRATTMFSFVLIGLNVGRIPNIYSSLYTSLFILLLFNPLMISQVGFQLSYAAVIGIVALQPRIYQLINIKKIWLLDKIWSLTAVSLAAQLITFPLGLFYFTQFPVYFLISNLVVIPAATLIMYAGFAFLITIPIGIDFIINVFSFILNLLLHILHKSVTIIQNWPNGIIDEVYISLIMTVFLYLFTAILIVFLIQRQRKYLFYLSIVSFFIVIGFLSWNINNKLESKTIVYSVKNQNLIGFYSGGKIVFWGDSIILNDFENLKYNTFRDVWKYGQKADNIIKVVIGEDFSNKDLTINDNYALFNNTSFVISENILVKNFKGKKFKADFLIISPKTKTYASRLLEFYEPETIILNGYSKSKRIIKTKETIELNKIEHFNLTESGAHQINFKSKVDFPATIQEISHRILEICRLK